MKGKWSTTVSPKHFETQVITLTDLSKGPWMVTIKGRLQTTLNFFWQETWFVGEGDALGKGAEALCLSFPS